MGRRGLTAAVVAAVLLGAGAACGDDGGSPGAAGDGGAPLVLATTSIWADVTANVACDGLATVAAIIPAGADAHGFEPSLADRRRIEEAALVVQNGLGLEGSLLDTLQAAEGDGATTFTVSDHVALPAAADDPGDDHDDGDDHAPGHEHGHDHGEDPHLWLDPQLVDDALDPLAEALVTEVGLDATAVDACVTDYRQRLAAVDDEIEAMVAQLPPERRLLVTSHDSFGHFARRYGFEVLGSIVPSTSSLAEASPATLEALAAQVEATGVVAVFTDEAVDGGDARALADRVDGVQLVPLHVESLDEPGSPASTYLGLLREDARLIVDALGGDAP